MKHCLISWRCRRNRHIRGMRVMRWRRRYRLAGRRRIPLNRRLDLDGLHRKNAPRQDGDQKVHEAKARPDFTMVVARYCRPRVSERYQPPKQITLLGFRIRIGRRLVRLGGDTVIPHAGPRRIARLADKSHQQKQNQFFHNLMY